MKKKFFTQGFTLVEVLISSAIILAIVIALLAVHSMYLKTALGNAESIQASYLAEEGLEVVRFWRDSSWNGKIAPLSLNTAYGLSFSGSTWSTTTSRTVGSFERSITVTAVMRNASSDIVSAGGSVDSDTLLITSSVSWSKGGATTTKSISTYLTNLYGN